MLYPLSYEGGAGRKRGRKPRRDLEPELRRASYAAASGVPTMIGDESGAI